MPVIVENYFLMKTQFPIKALISFYHFAVELTCFDFPIVEFLFVPPGEITLKVLFGVKMSGQNALRLVCVR